MKTISKQIETEHGTWRNRNLGSLVAADLMLILCVDTSAEPTQAIVDPPTYNGTLSGQPACNTIYHTVGREPATTGTKYPLSLYFVGTLLDGSPPATPTYASSLAPQAANEAMASRGFVAVSVEYDNKASFGEIIFAGQRFNAAGFNAKLGCMFASTPDSLITKLCSRSNVDCNKGIAIFGHSQGGLLAFGASKFDRRVTAAFATGYSPVNNFAIRMPFNRMRLVGAIRDPLRSNRDPATMAAVTGVGVPGSVECQDTVPDQCLRADGSGWKIVRQSELVANTAGHCWFSNPACDDINENLDPMWTATAAPLPVFSLAATADWLKATSSQPRACPSQRITLRTLANSSGTRYYVSQRQTVAGKPVEASATTAGATEVFACLERGTGKVVLRAADGSYVSADPSTLALSAAATAANATEFQLSSQDADNIALKSTVNNMFVSAKPPTTQPSLTADASSVTTTEKYQAVQFPETPEL